MLSPATLAARDRAEQARSASEAARTRVRPTLAEVFRRYQEPAAGTAFALEYAFHLVGNVRGLRVLDLGCGSGAHAMLLAARGARVIGLDLSEDLLRLARRRAELDAVADRVAPLQASAHALPVVTGSIDVVFGNAILHHLDLDAAAREVHRVLAPGGRAVFREPLRNSRTVSRLRQLIPYRQQDVSPFEHPLTTVEINRFAAPFAQLRAREFELPTVRLADVLGLPSRARNGLRVLDRWILDRTPALKYLSTLCVFEVRKAMTSAG